jgi:hypothetical protein
VCARAPLNERRETYGGNQKPVCIVCIVRKIAPPWGGKPPHRTAENLFTVKRFRTPMLDRPHLQALRRERREPVCGLFATQKSGQVPLPTPAQLLELNQADSMKCYGREPVAKGNKPGGLIRRLGGLLGHWKNEKV